MAVWFDFLEAQGLFKPSNNPDPVQVKDGMQIPYWDSLAYLEKLSIEIKEGKQTEYAAKIIDIISNVSNNPKDNYHTWYVFIKILVNLPNECIPTSIFDFVPVWLNSRFETSVQTSEITERLIPKLLGASATPDDIAKAEVVLKHLVKLKKVKTNPVDEDLECEGYGYKSLANLYFLKAAFIDKGLIKKIIEHCSDEIIFSVADSLKLILLDYPRGIRIPSEMSEGASVVATIRNKNLIVHSKPTDDGDLTSKEITDYESLSDEELKDSVTQALTAYRPELRDSFTNIIMNRLFEDLNSYFRISKIEDLQDDAQYGDNLKDVFSLIMRDLLTEKGRQEPIEGVTLYDTLFFSRTYRMAFFKRLIFYAIGTNWNPTFRNLFIKLVESNPVYFRDFKYESEIRFILSHNASQFTDEDIQFLDNVIAQGPKYAIPDEQETEYWYYRIYGALRKNPHYTERFREQAEKVNAPIAEDVDESRMVAQPVNFESPYSASELLSMPHDEIIRTIREFNPERVWRGPSKEGFARQLSEAIKQDPDYFSQGIENYVFVESIYAYFMLEGFREAWTNKKKFDWGTVLKFCKDYVSSVAFLVNDLVAVVRTEWGDEHRLVIGVIGNLITEGTRSDETSFDPAHLPLAQDLLTYIIKRLKASDELDETHGYVMGAFNSTAGKPIRGLLDLSLRTGRLSADTDNRWDPLQKELFIETLERKITDSYVFVGLYYQQIFFLDQAWITEQFKAYYDLEENLWQAFIEGFLFSDAPYNETVYRLSIPHYKRAITLQVYGSELYRGNGIAKHLGVMYLRGYDTLDTENVLTLFLTRSNPEGVGGFISFIRQQEDYIMGLPIEQRTSFQVLVLKFWKYILDTFAETEAEEELKLLSNLNTLIGYVDLLDEVNSELILGTIPYVDRNYNTHHVLDALNRLKSKGDPAIISLYIGKILNAIGLNDYLRFSEKDLEQLINFVYDHGKKDLADRFCNTLALKGYDFQKSAYAKNNS